MLTCTYGRRYYKSGSPSFFKHKSLCICKSSDCLRVVNKTEKHAQNVKNLLTLCHSEKMSTRIWPNLEAVIWWYVYLHTWQLRKHPTIDVTTSLRIFVFKLRARLSNKIFESFWHLKIKCTTSDINYQNNIQSRAIKCWCQTHH